VPPHETNTLDELLAESRERANQFFYFDRWITACQLYKRMPPTATTANGSSR
jgi:hypothetical protein